MSRAGVLLAIILAIASVGVLAQDTTQHAPVPNASAQGASASSAPAKEQSGRSESSQATPAAEGQTEPASGTSNDPGAARQLPQTSTILPLLGLIGLGSLVAGLFARR